MDEVKGVIYVNLSIFSTSLSLLLSKVLFVRNPKLELIEMLMIRGMLASCVSLIVINRRLKEVTWD